MTTMRRVPSDVGFRRSISLCVETPALLVDSKRPGAHRERGVVAWRGCERVIDATQPARRGIHLRSRDRGRPNLSPRDRRVVRRQRQRGRCTRWTRARRPASRPASLARFPVSLAQRPPSPQQWCPRRTPEGRPPLRAPVRAANPPVRSHRPGSACRGARAASRSSCRSSRSPWKLPVGSLRTAGPSRSRSASAARRQDHPMRCAPTLRPHAATRCGAASPTQPLGIPPAAGDLFLLRCPLPWWCEVEATGLLDGSHRPPPPRLNLRPPGTVPPTWVGALAAAVRTGSGAPEEKWTDVAPTGNLPRLSRCPIA
jgi:hypothetical protein